MKHIVQQLQSPIKFDVAAFEGDSAANWLTWSQRFVDKAKACGFERELTTAVGEGSSVGADVFGGSKVDLVRFQNACVGWVTFISST